MYVYIYIYIYIYVYIHILRKKKDCYIIWKSVHNCQEMDVLHQKGIPPTFPKDPIDDHETYTDR